MLAARAALRTLPIVWTAHLTAVRAGIVNDVVMPVFHATSLAWAAGKYPAKAWALKDTASDAANAVYAASDAYVVIAHHKGAADPAYAACRAAAAAANAAAATGTAGSFTATAYADCRTAAAEDEAEAAAVFHQDVAILQNGLSVGELGDQKLWANSGPQRISDLWSQMKEGLLARHEDWEVWTDWYEARLAGTPSIEALEIARVTIADYIWKQGPKVVNAEIKKLIEKYNEMPPTPQPDNRADLPSFFTFAEALDPERSRQEQSPLGSAEQATAAHRYEPQSSRPPADARGKVAPTSRVVLADLAEIASPTPFIARDGRLDAGPNPVFDTPKVDDELLTLPVRQQAIIRTIVSGLPRNAPVHLKTTLNEYSDELKARGVQPTLGLLKDMEAIIETDFLAPDAQNWLAAGLKVAFQRFQANHDLFIQHFPLDPRREEVFSGIHVDEENAIGEALKEPFEDVAKATSAAHAAGLTTDEFVKIVGSMTEFAKVVSTQPRPADNSHAPSSTAFLNTSQLTLPHVGPDDKLIPTVTRPSATKRIVLTGLAFFERTYNLLGTTATLLTTPIGASLLTKLGDAINALSKLIHW